MLQSVSSPAGNTDPGPSDTPRTEERRPDPTATPVPPTPTPTAVPGNIQATVVNAANSAPIAGANVVVTNAAGAVVGRLPSGPSGEATVNALPAGCYTFRANATGFTPGFTGNDICVQDARTTSFTLPLQPLTGAAASAAQGSLSSNVIDALTGRPINGANVQAVDASGRAVAMLRTDPNGAAASGSLPAGWYSVRAAGGPRPRLSGRGRRPAPRAPRQPHGGPRPR